MTGTVLRPPGYAHSWCSSSSYYFDRRELTAFPLLVSVAENPSSYGCEVDQPFR